jgi:RNA polymerase sigma factor (sigma-70 family)
MNINYRSEEELLAGLRISDEYAIRFLYKSYFPMVSYFITTNNGTEAEAKDIYQDSIIVLLENLQKSDFMLNCKLKTYLYSVSRRLWLKKLAEKNRFLGRIDDYEQFLPSEETNEDWDEKDRQIQNMQDSLKQLGDPCKTILEDFFINNFNMQQICEKMGYTNADTAKNQKYKCLVRLKKIFFSGYHVMED